MPNNAAETLIGQTGSVWIAAVGTAFPATPTTAPSGSFTELGLINEAGVKAKPSQELAKFMAWQSMYPIRTIVTARNMAVAFALRQWNEVNLPLAFGGGAVTGAGPYTYTPPGITSDEYLRAVLIRWKDGTRNYDLRFLRAAPVDLGEIQLARTVMTDLQIALELRDDGDDATAPWTILSDDTNLG